MDYGGHDSNFSSNVVVTLPYDGQNCINVGSFKPGHGDSFYNNTCYVIGGRNPAQADRVATIRDCNQALVMSAENAYYTLSGNVTMQCGSQTLELEQVQAKGLERRSTGGAVPPPQDIVALGRRTLGLTTAALAATSGALLDKAFPRAPPGAIELEEAVQSAPHIPFKPFSAAYVSMALATPTNWTALGAVTPIKNQGPHGYCGTFGRVGTARRPRLSQYP
jgi:hypothetical protein